MAEEEDLELPPVRAPSLLSDEERELLTTLAGEYDLDYEELNALIEYERSKQGMGRRSNIHIWIRNHIAKIAARRLAQK